VQYICTLYSSYTENKGINDKMQDQDTSKRKVRGKEDERKTKGRRKEDERKTKGRRKEDER
jgi:hypothetical protein